MKNIIIFHTDMDGYVSAFLVEQYIRSTKPNDKVTFFPYNYGQDLNDIKAHIAWSKNSYSTYVIWMVDCTLPDDFMNQYASHIKHFDHHLSVIQSNKEWKNSLLQNNSTITISGYKDSHGNQAKQVAACELVHSILFGTEMPLVVYLSGRYDVWDHDDENKTKDLHSYINNQITPPNKFPFQCKWFTKLFSNDQEVYNAIEKGKLIRKILYNDNAQKIKNILSVNIDGYNIAYFNTVERSSNVFDYYLTLHSEIDGLISYYYNGYYWVASCYSVKESFSALDFLNKFKKVLNPIQIGGHKNACGMEFSRNDLIPFISFLER